MLWDEYSRHLQAKRTAASTILDYYSDWMRFSNWCWNDGLRNYAQIQKTHIMEFLISLEGRVAPATIQGYYRTLKALFRWATEEGLITANPMGGIPLPHAPEEPIETYTKDEFRKLYENANSERDRGLLLFLYDTGARSTEAAKLTWPCVDLEKRQAQIVKGKGQRTRTVPFGELTGVSFRLLSLSGSDSLLVFPSRSGKALTHSGVRQMVKKLCTKSGVPLRHEIVHAFRHTSACNLLEATNGDIMYVKQVLGHSSINTTLKYVRHLEGNRVLAKAKTFDSPADRL